MRDNGVREPARAIDRNDSKARGRNIDPEQAKDPGQEKTLDDSVHMKVLVDSVVETGTVNDDRKELDVKPYGEELVDKETETGGGRYSFGSTDIRMRNIKATGGSTMDPGTSWQGPIGRKPGTKRVSASKLGVERRGLAHWISGEGRAKAKVKKK